MSAVTKRMVHTVFYDCIIVSVLLLILQTPGVLGQQKQNSKLTPESFTTDGLMTEEVMTNIYLGDFVDIPYDRDDIHFDILYTAYLDAYAVRCKDYLPTNKVEMTEQECARERITKDGYGIVVDRSCVDWVTVGTNLYADPKMYMAKLRLDRIQDRDALRTAIGMMIHNNPIAGASNLRTYTDGIKNDMDLLLQINGCASPAMKRFQKNLRSFALNKPPVRLGEEGESATAGISYRNQDYARFIDDLVFIQSRKWLMNQYIRGSVSRVSVSYRNQQGMPSKIVAHYLFKGGFDGGQSQGSVTLTFNRDGLPGCMYFYDFPNRCRTPNRKVVADFVHGTYEK